MNRSIHRRSRRRARGDKGVALVEFALVLPLLAMLLLGTITGGFALNRKQQITYATREAARYAASVAPNQSFASGTWAENVRNLAVDRSAGDLVVGDVCVSLVQGNPGVVVSPASTYSTDAGGGPCVDKQAYSQYNKDYDTGLRVQVTGSLTGDRRPSINLVLFGSISVTIKTEATAKSEGKL